MLKSTNYLQHLLEAEGWKELPKGWKQSSLKKFSKSLTGKKATQKGFFDKCVKRMKGKLDNPEAFCASIKDERHGSTYWRGKGKSAQQAGKDVKRIRNVQQEGIPRIRVVKKLFNPEYQKSLKTAFEVDKDKVQKKIHKEAELQHPPVVYQPPTGSYKQPARRTLSRDKKIGIALAATSAAAFGEKKIYDKVKESISENETYVGVLGADTRAAAKEWQGPNIPYGDDSNRPNLIRKCTMMEDATQKINCLRKLRDQAAMNPYYQHRIDRYIDEITDTYEPTNEPGTIPGNEFKTSGVGEDTITEAYVQEQMTLNEIESKIKLLTKQEKESVAKCNNPCCVAKAQLQYTSHKEFLYGRASRQCPPSNKKPNPCHKKYVLKFSAAARKVDALKKKVNRVC
ncbi:MAG: hypothetical protein ACTSX6_02195 [Candidatus Heimdallarchaeaceae archaeon]